MPGKQQRSRLNVLDSQTPVIRIAAEYLYRHFGGFGNIQQQHQLKFNRDGEEYFVAVLPFSDRYGLNWLIAIAVPESDFMGQINRNTRNTILLCAAALLLSTIAGVLSAKWVTHSLLRLNEAAKDIAARKFVGASRGVAIALLLSAGLMKSAN